MEVRGGGQCGSGVECEGDVTGNFRMCGSVLGRGRVSLQEIVLVTGVFVHCVCFAPVCKRWQRLAILSWRSMKNLSFENMFKSIFRAGKHGEPLMA